MHIGKEKRIISLLLILLMLIGSVDFSTLPVSAEGVEANDNKEKNNNIDTNWTDFRGSDNNMGITSAKTPLDSDETCIKWGINSQRGKMCAPLIVGDYIVTCDAADDRNVILCKIDRKTGEVVVKRKLKEEYVNPNYQLIYAEGMYISIGYNGWVRAYDENTLETLWYWCDVDFTYRKTIQYSTIKYKDGYLYVIISCGYTGGDYLICMEAKDEDPTTYQKKKLLWSKLIPLGSHGSGAYINDKVVIIGNEGRKKTGKSSLFSLSKTTGEEVDSISEELTGDICSYIVYNESDGRVYFTSESGYLYSVKLNDEGTFDKESLKSLKVGEMTTSTPVIYKNRCYLGIGVVDIAKDGELSIAYTYGTDRFSKSSGLLTTGYEEESGYVYVYFCDKELPGGLYCIKDKAGQTKADIRTIYEPKGDYSGESICSPIADAEGNIYYRNDSGYLMALERNPAFISDIKIEGGELNRGKGFNPEKRDNLVIFQKDTKNVKLVVTEEEGTQITIDGKDTRSIDITPDNEKTQFVNVTASKDGYIKTYKFEIRCLSDDARLANLYAAYGTSITERPCTVVKGTSEDIYDFKAFGNRKSDICLWPVASDSNAKIEVFPLDNVDKQVIDKDGKIIEEWRYDEGCYDIYQAKDSDTAFVKVVITAEDGITSNEYKVLLCNESFYSPKIIDVTTSNDDRTDNSTVIRFNSNEEGTLHYLVVKQGESVSKEKVSDSEYTKRVLYGDNAIEINDISDEAVDIYFVVSDGKYECDLKKVEVSKAQYYKEAYEEVTKKINAIGEVKLTDECKALIDEARKAYDALTAPAKNGFSADTLKVLTDAEAEYTRLKEEKEAMERKIAQDKEEALKVDEKIQAIGTVSLDKESLELIEEARKAYESLTEDQKAYVTKAKILEEAKAEYARLKEEKEALERKIAQDKEEALKVDEKIQAIGTVSLDKESLELIEEARKAYESLTNEQKEYVTELKVLEEAEAEYGKLLEDKEYREKTVSDISLKSTSATLYIGGKVTIVPVILPDTALNKEVTYKSSNSKVATVNAKGLVTAKKAGTATITVTTKDQEKTAKFVVKVINNTITLNSKKVVLYTKTKTSATLKATVRGLKNTVTWKSSNPKVATVNAKGLVKAKKAGNTTITATSNGVSVTCSVKVLNPTLTIKKSHISIKKGKTANIGAKATPKAKIIYKSSNKKIASVDSKGYVKGKKPGRVKITVTANGITKKVEVFVS